ncbi:MAG: tetratricopeptide repeat protein [Polyangiaceae bacterium]|nr:tetratricopeptide repeat protein [Polyangiaceae bacterium]MCL4750414.1 tetratricopeptide repeat protein [Myxococcales bacterium]
MVAAAVAAHATVLGGGLIWLDHAHLGARLALRPPAEWAELFRQPFAGTGYYRPLTALSLSLDALAGSTALYHTVNLALHAAAAALLLFAASALGASRRAATLGALLFAVHPIGSLVAGAIAFRSEALVACGLFGLIVAHRRERPVWAVLCLLVAGLSKETGLALAPLFLVALALGPGRRSGLWLLGAEALALALALGLRLGFAPAWSARFPELVAGQAVGTRLGAFAKSAGAVLLPVDRSICDAFPITELAAPLALAGGLLALGLCLLGWRGRTLGLLCVLSTLPSLQLVPTLRWWSPHYLYLPAGLFLVLVAERLEQRGARAYAVAVCLVPLLGALSWKDGRRYRSDETLWRPEVTREPACREGHFYLAEAARARRDSVAALLHYEAALRSRPGVLAFVDLDATLTNQGLVLFAQGRWAEAREAFEAALERTPDELGRRKLRHDLAAVSLASGDAPRALRELEEEIRRPDALRESLLLHQKARQALEAHQLR